MTPVRRLTRREFLSVTGLGGTGLMLAAALPVGEVGASPAVTGENTDFVPDLLLRVASDGTAEIWVAKTEMGQGVRTGLPMIIAEELEIPWESVRVMQAPGANDGRYGPQLTGGSMSVRTQYDRLRRIGAVGREMLITAAANAWDVGRDTCSARDGTIHGPNGQRAGYGELAAAASELPVPDADTVPLKAPADFRLIGSRIRRTDGVDYTHGQARFTMDTRLPGMRYAVVARCPIYGGRVGRYDEAAALKVPGVKQVVEYEGLAGAFYIAPGVAVVAESTWAAMTGVRALAVEWEPGENSNASTDELSTRLRELSTRRGLIMRNDGNVTDSLNKAAQVVEATYELPFLAHATMEPMNCTIRVDKDACEIWTASQDPQDVQQSVARYLELPEDKVIVHVTLAGGGFGRRLYVDVELEAAGIARHVDGPVQVVWTREDDIQHGRYRPTSLHVLRGALDAGGMPSAWDWRILTTYQRRFDPEDFPAYAVPSYRVGYTYVPFVLPRGAWRATVNSTNPFVVHSFLDELAAAAGRDPLELRLDMLRASTRAATSDSSYDNARMIRVVEVAAERAGWGRTRPEGTGRGLAFFSGYESYVAEVAEVRMENGRPRVERVVCAVDCGQVINPDLVEAQCEGAIAFALSAALKQRITMASGRVEQENFHDYPILQIDDMPAIETVIVDSDAAPGGMGEPPLPPLAPAVTNAIFDATGTRIRRLPIGPV